MFNKIFTILEFLQFYFSSRKKFYIAGIVILGVFTGFFVGRINRQVEVVFSKPVQSIGNSSADQNDIWSKKQ